MITFTNGSVMSSTDMNSNFQEVLDRTINIVPSQLALAGPLSLKPVAAGSITAALANGEKGISITRTGSISQPLLSISTGGAGKALNMDATTIFDFTGGLTLTSAPTATALSGSAQLVATTRAVPFPASSTAALVFVIGGATGALSFNTTTKTLWRWNGTAYVDTLALSSSFQYVSGQLAFVPTDKPAVFIPTAGFKTGGTFGALNTSSSAEQTVASITFTLPETRLAVFYAQFASGANFRYSATVDAVIEIATRIYIGSTLAREVKYSRGNAVFANSLTIPIREAFFYSEVMAAGTYTVTARLQRLSATSVTLLSTGSSTLELRALFL